MFPLAFLLTICLQLYYTRSNRWFMAKRAFQQTKSNMICCKFMDRIISQQITVWSGSMTTLHCISPWFAMSMHGETRLVELKSIASHLSLYEHLSWGGNAKVANNLNFDLIRAVGRGAIRNAYLNRNLIEYRSPFIHNDSCQVVPSPFNPGFE